jgi:hypothetical protein
VKHLPILIFFVSFSLTSYSQESSKITLRQFLQELENKFSISIQAEENLPQLDLAVDTHSQGSYAESLRERLLSMELAFIELDSIIYIFDSNSIDESFNPLLNVNLSKKEIQDKHVIAPIEKKGDNAVKIQIISSKNEEAIPGATIRINPGNYGLVTGKNGSAMVELPNGIFEITVTFTGYETRTIKKPIFSNTELLIELFDSSILMKEILVRHKSDLGDNSKLDAISLKGESLKKIPSFLGEVDIIQNITTHPGVTTTGEGTTGFHVRGGDADQNILLLDGVPIFNPTHLFGFVATLNPDFIDEFSLLKGGIPARYGGRISSYLDVRSKTGNYNQLSASGSAGMISSKLQLDGPILKDKISFNLSSRYAYPNYLLALVDNPRIKNSEAGFYDFNSKVTVKLSNKTLLSTGFYKSTNTLKIQKDTSYSWSNLAYFAELSHFWKQRTLTLHLSSSNYNNNIESHYSPLLSKYESSIRYYGLKATYTQQHANGSITEFGQNSSIYQIEPGSLKPTNGNSIIQSRSIPREKSIETSLFVSHERKITDKLNLTLGIRYSIFNTLGESTEYKFDPNQPKEISSITDTVIVKPNFSNRLGGMEPRINLTYNISPNSSIKIGYNLIRQYIHLISNSTSISPLDLWKSSDHSTAPQIGWQLSSGFQVSSSNKSYEFSFEPYYKKIKNIIDYKDGATLYLNPVIETQLIPGVSEAYGAEFMIKKNSPKFSGWLSYTYSRSFRMVQGKFREETINQGMKYPSNFDKPNNLSIVSTYSFTQKVILSANFSYSTGRPITLPAATYYYNNNLIADFSDRNQGRVPDYHRLDLSLKFSNPLRKNPKYRSEWTFSVYNLYARKNPFSVYFNSINRNRLPQTFQLSIIGVMVPSITYSFKFIPTTNEK